MGFLSFVFFGVVPVLGCCTVVSFRLGQELPRASRNAGQAIGMGYNYLKVVLKHLTPQSDHGVDLVRKARRAGQQAFAFSNEVKLNLVEASPLVHKALPGLTEDPFTKFGLLPASKPEAKAASAELNQVLLKVFEERAEILRKKEEKKAEAEALSKF